MVGRPSLRTVSVSVQAFAKVRGGCILAVRLQPGRELTQHHLGRLRALALVGVPHLAGHVRTTLLRKVIAYVASLVNLTALHDGAAGEDVKESLPNALGAVNDEEQRRIDAEPALDQDSSAGSRLRR